MLEGPFASFLLTAAIGLFLAFLTWLIARRSGMMPLQNNLVDTLQDTVQALEKQHVLTQDERDKAVALATETAVKVGQLNDAIVDLAAENAALRRKAGLPPRHRSAAEREAAES